MTDPRVEAVARWQWHVGDDVPTANWEQGWAEALLAVADGKAEERLAATPEELREMYTRYPMTQVVRERVYRIAETYRRALAVADAELMEASYRSGFVAGRDQQIAHLQGLGYIRHFVPIDVPAAQTDPPESS